MKSNQSFCNNCRHSIDDHQVDHMGHDSDICVVEGCDCYGDQTFSRPTKYVRPIPTYNPEDLLKETSARWKNANPKIIAGPDETLVDDTHRINIRRSGNAGNRESDNAHEIEVHTMYATGSNWEKYEYPHVNLKVSFNQEEKDRAVDFAAKLAEFIDNYLGETIANEKELLSGVVDGSNTKEFIKTVLSETSNAAVAEAWFIDIVEKAFDAGQHVSSKA